MPHIHTEPGQHDLTVSAYIIRTDTKEPTIMLHKHKKLGIYLQFGGHVELHEHTWKAITHELKEEAGYDISQVQLLQPPDMIKKLNTSVLHPYPLIHQTHKFGDMNHNHTDIAFAFIASEQAKNHVDASESQDIKLFTRQQLIEAPSHKVPEDIKTVGLYLFDVCLEKWDRVATTNFSK
jgi:8-oxo-dGTP diphosphatase